MSVGSACSGVLTVAETFNFHKPKAPKNADQPLTDDNKALFLIIFSFLKNVYDIVVHHTSALSKLVYCRCDTALFHE